MDLESAQPLAFALFRAARLTVSFPFPFGKQALRLAPFAHSLSAALSWRRSRRYSQRLVSIPVRLFRTLCDEVVYQNADVRLVAPEDERLFAAHAQRRVDSRDEPLSSRLLVSRGSVYLSARKRFSPASSQATGEAASARRSRILSRSPAAVCARVRSPLSFARFQTALRGTSRSKSSGRRPRALRRYRFEEDGVSILFGELYYLVVDGRAVSGPLSFEPSPCRAATVRSIS